MGHHFPVLKIAPSHAECGFNLIHGTLGLPSPQPKRHLDRSAVFAGLWVHDRDRLTDRPRYSVASGRPHLRTYKKYCDAT